MKQHWHGESRRHLVCVDSYEHGILAGWLYTPLGEGIRFSSLTQLLMAMEELLDGSQLPQAYTAPRRFREVPETSLDTQPAPLRQKGKLATFELNVLFRQHSSWQGMLQWRETAMEESFRSVLELILLMDSALRSQ